MSKTAFRHVYGPVFSRRLGRSLGVDLVPFKTCTYDCVYCQLGRTTNKTVERKEYISVKDVLDELEEKLAETPAPDYISLAGSGEPTLNSGIGDLVAGIKRLTDIPVAVLTNGSLLWNREVQDAIMKADLVMPSLDAGDENIFINVNRPHPGIAFGKLVDGLVEFAGRFSKPVWLEVFLLAGVTGILSEVHKIAALAKRIRPKKVQLNTVSRPPCEEFAFPVHRDQMKSFVKMFEIEAEIISEERSSESFSRNSVAIFDADILRLLERRPCTVMDISSGLGLHVTEVTKKIEPLIQKGKVISVRQNGALFYKVVKIESQGPTIAIAVPEKR